MREPSALQRLRHERALWRYIAALESGDLDAIAVIIQQAEKDAVLEQMIFEMHETFQTDEELQALIQEEKEMEIEEGIHKSGMIGQFLGPLAPQIEQKKRKPSLWFQLLAAALVVVSLTGLLLFYSGFFQLGSRTAGQPIAYNWCVTATSQIDPREQALILNNVAAISPDDVWAAGDVKTSNQSMTQYNLQVEHWTGENWTLVPSPDTSGLISNLKQKVDTIQTPAYFNSQEVSLNGLTALATNNVWAVGALTIWGSQVQTVYYQAGQTLIEHWDGKRWQYIQSPNGVDVGDNALNSVAAVAPNDIWAVGYANAGGLPAFSPTQTRPLVEHWNGWNWSIVSLPTSLLHGSLTAVRAISANDVWAVGSGEASSPSLPLVIHWNGSSWSSAALPSILQSGAFSDITTIASNDAWAVGDFSSTRARMTAFSRLAHWNGRQWTSVEGAQVGNTDSMLSSITATGPNDVWAVGYVMDTASIAHALIEHWDGQKWKVVSSRSSPQGQLTHVVAFASRVWAIGVTSSIATGNVASNAASLVETNC